MRALTKDIFREIRKTRSRFLSILVMVMLASLFLCGLRSAAPDMQITADGYFDAQQLMDLQVISTLGLVEEDVAALAETKGVAYAEGSYSLDARTVQDGREQLLKLQTLSNRVSVPVLLEGRLPEQPWECAVEPALLQSMGMEIGDQLTVDGSDELSGQLQSLQLTITGVVESPMYIGMERGTSALGDGKVDRFVLLPRNAFTMEYYTEIYLLAENAVELLCYDDSYEALLRALEDRVEPVAEAQIEQRHQDIVSEAQAELDDAVAEIEDGERELAAQEADGRAELADARQKLDDGWAEYENGKTEFEQEIAAAETSLADAKRELDDGRQLLLQNEQALSDNRSELLRQESEAESALLEAERQLEDQTVQLADAEMQFKQGVAEYEAGAAQLAEAQAQLKDLYAQRAAAQLVGYVPPELQQAITELEQAVETTASQLESAGAALEQTRAELDAAQQQLTAGREELAAQREAAEAELDAAWAQIGYAEEEIARAKQRLEQGQADYDAGLNDLAAAHAEGEQKLDEALAELEQGEADYTEGLQTLETEIADARTELDEAWLEVEDARSEIAGIERGKLYLMDRSVLPNYVGYKQDSDRMYALGHVFPLLFFVVAALVCLTTMTRMVEEQRTQIGVLKAVGYGTGAVARKFLVYGCLAALIGCVVGCIIGTYLIPWIICTCYGIMYTLPEPVLAIHWATCAGVAAASIGCTVLAVLWAVWASIVRTPASLMRPKTPKAGKRILLERITPLWRRLNFSTKVSARNLFRYKKRFWMTVIGVGGCTALIIAGFGLQEGIMSIIDRQFDCIFTYDLQVTMDDTAPEVRQEELLRWVEEDSRTGLYTGAYFSTVTLMGEKRAEEGYLVATDEEQTFLEQYRLRDYKTGELLELPAEGCVLTSKIAELLDLEPGDTLTVDADSRVSIPIAAVAENYVHHYVYLSAEAYKAVFGELPERNTIYVTLTDGSEQISSAYSADLLKKSAVAAVTNINSAGESVRDSLNVVNYPVLIIILSAAALAFVVLYNLTNINITERMRELATLKVLGFFDKELAMYVYRENIVLTLLGIALGQLMGFFLSTYLVRTVEIDMVMFIRHATWTSYLWSVVLSIVFALLVNMTMYYRLKRIDMIDSLKSVE